MSFRDADFDGGISFMQVPSCRRLLRSDCWPKGSCKKHVIYYHGGGGRRGCNCFATIKTILVLRGERVDARIDIRVDVTVDAQVEVQVDVRADAQVDVGVDARDDARDDA